MGEHNVKAFNKLTGGLIKPSLDWLLPRTCLACESRAIASHYPLCQTCYENLPFQPRSCRQCGQSFAARDDHCGRCLAKPPSFKRCFCPFQYSSPVNNLVRDFKYHDRWELAKPLAQILAREIIAHDLVCPELLICVPSHISRLRSRGYNQSALLARQLGKILHIPVDTEIISKPKKTAPQAELSLKQRSKNLRGCFRIRGSIQAKSVAIVDDVVTTGATAEEIAKTLKRNGVDYIQMWGIAHTV